MTKDTAESHNSQMQWPVVSTLRQETKKHVNRKVEFEGTPKFDPYWNSQLVALHGKYRVGIRIMSVNKEYSHSWVRVSHGSNKVVTNLNNEQETSEVQFKVYALKLNAKNCACRSKAKAKPQRREPACPSPRTIPFGKRTWTLRLCGVEETKSSSSTCKNTRRRRQKFSALSSLV